MDSKSLLTAAIVYLLVAVNGELSDDGFIVHCWDEAELS